MRAIRHNQILIKIIDEIVLIQKRKRQGTQHPIFGYR